MEREFWTCFHQRKNNDFSREADEALWLEFWSHIFCKRTMASSFSSPIWYTWGLHLPSTASVLMLQCKLSPESILSWISSSFLLPQLSTFLPELGCLLFVTVDLDNVWKCLWHLEPLCGIPCFVEGKHNYDHLNSKFWFRLIFT